MKHNQNFVQGIFLTLTVNTGINNTYVFFYLSVHQISIFLRNGLLFLNSNLFQDVRQSEYLKAVRVLFSRKTLISPNVGKKGSKWPQDKIF